MFSPDRQRVATMNSQACWTDMPPELVDEILQFCDERSLLTLSQVNHQLSSLVISRYIIPQITSGVIRIHSTHSSENFLLRILCSTFRLPGNIQHVDYCLAPNSQHNRYINDLRGLTIFIRRMSKLASLSIDSGDNSVFYSTSKKSHLGIWAKLIKVVRSKKYERLEIRERGLVVYEQSLPPLEAPKARRGSILRPLFRLFHSASAPKDEATVIPPPPPPLSLLTSKIIQPLQRKLQLNDNDLDFLSPVLRTIRAGTTITFIELSLTSLYSRGSKEWKKTLDRIHFPALQSFSFTQSPQAPSPVVFLKFLKRHPGLIHLDLGADFGRDSNGGVWSPTKWRSWRQPPNFPNLETLHMFPQVFQWLVPDFRRCPKLRSITLKSHSQPPGNANIGPDNPQDVIRSILNDIHTSTSITCPLEVEIQVPPNSSEWISKLYTSGETPPCWPRVKKVTVEKTDIGSDALVDLGLMFPSLEDFTLSA